MTVKRPSLLMLTASAAAMSALAHGVAAEEQDARAVLHEGAPRRVQLPALRRGTPEPARRCPPRTPARERLRHRATHARTGPNDRGRTSNRSVCSIRDTRAAAHCRRSKRSSRAAMFESFAARFGGPAI